MVLASFDCQNFLPLLPGSDVIERDRLKSGNRKGRRIGPQVQVAVFFVHELGVLPLQVIFHLGIRFQGIVPSPLALVYETYRIKDKVA